MSTRGTVPRIAIALGLAWVAAVGLAAPTVSRPRCEHRTNPQGIDAPRPRLAWILESDAAGTCSRRERRRGVVFENARSDVRTAACVVDPTAIV